MATSKTQVIGLATARRLKKQAVPFILTHCKDRFAIDPADMDVRDDEHGRWIYVKRATLVEVDAPSPCNTDYAFCIGLGVKETRATMLRGTDKC